MKTLNFSELEKVQGGANDCAATILSGVIVGGVLGNGIGAVAGAVIAGTSSSCLGWW